MKYPAMAHKITMKSNVAFSMQITPGRHFFGILTSK